MKSVLFLGETIFLMESESQTNGARSVSKVDALRELPPKGKVNNDLLLEVGVGLGETTSEAEL